MDFRPASGPAGELGLTRELERAYEELQATVDELGRANDELVAMSAELETVNGELGDRTREALRSRAVLAALLAGIDRCVVALDQDLRVTAWSEATADLWRLRADEAEGRRLLDLDLGLPSAGLLGPLREAFAGRKPADVSLAARDGRGRPIACTISFAPLGPRDDAVDGVVLLISTGTLEA